MIWFAVWSSVVHGAIMTVQSFGDDHIGHLWGDVAALFLAAVVLSVLVVSSGLNGLLRKPALPCIAAALSRGSSESDCPCSGG